MKRIPFLSTVTLAATLASSGAYALSNRTFVSGNGSDANPCSLAAPCRSFAGAILQTTAGGEIAVLDTAGYGAVAINKAISIVNEEGVEAGITATSGNAITINGGPSDVVNLRGLTLVGAGGSTGITYNSGGALNIQNCVIRGFVNDGLLLVPTGGTDINISNTIVSGNVGAGIVLQPSGTGLKVTASFEQVQAIHNGGTGFGVNGSSMTGSLAAIAADSLASGNANGFFISAPVGFVSTTFAVANSKAANNQVGLANLGNSAMYLSGSIVTGNAVHGFFIEDFGVIDSYGNNTITDTNNSGTLTSLPLQ
jgi:hypothetical protein